MKIMEAVDNFKKENNEAHRFEKLMEVFMDKDVSADFQVACMNFINVVVHSAESLNYRVHLQYEFTLLGLDDYLEVSILLLSFPYLSLSLYLSLFLSLSLSLSLSLTHTL